MKMITRNHKSTALIIIIVCTLLVVALWPSLTQAAPPALPPRPPNLPPRPTPQPAPPSLTFESEPEPDDGGGHIELYVQPTQAGLWTIVQWQDNAGGWHDIKGWQGALDDDHKKVWWVAPAASGKGPFRWTVYQGLKGKLLAQSELFYLPSAGETVKTEVSLVSSQSTARPNSPSILPSLSPDGGYIKLCVQPAQAGLWTIVQWQDSAGDWHNIEGWQGTLDEDHEKVWWVAPAASGRGPFRWAVYQSQKDKLLAQSEPFYLPSADETVRIEMSLAP